MTKSTHKCEIVPVVLEPHPNADTLSIVRPFGYTVCVRTEDWVNRKLAAYVVPDSMVDTRRPEFSFLAKDENLYQRIKVKKLRGIVSQGLLVPAPEGSKIGDDVVEQLGIMRYEEPDTIDTSGEFENGPFSLNQKYDLDSFYRYGKEVFKEGEPLLVREKINGSNSFYIYAEDRIWCASRRGFKVKDPKSMWWQVLDKQPEIYEWCKNNPGFRLYGEVYGHVKGMLYGPQKKIRFAAFDIMNDKGHWLNPEEAQNLSPNIPWAPMVAHLYPYNFEELIMLADGPSLIDGAGHFREGVVVEPFETRWHYKIGRVKLKIVSNTYLEKS